jgi:hypothetical protein
MNGAMVRATHRNEVVRLVSAAVGTPLDVMDIDEDRLTRLHHLTPMV